jgi:anthranilate phosphoribosyltransferase
MSAIASAALLSDADDLRELIKIAVRGGDLGFEQMHAAIDAIVDGAASPAQIGALLAALAAKGETPDELAGTAAALRARAVPVVSERRPLLDVCGTGGDGSGSFNISTAAAFVAAGAGALVAKHGNRAMTSRCGSADVLVALGVRIDIPPEIAVRALDEIGLVFLFAQAHHPAMRAVAPARREVGFRSIFNLAGPLANPAGAQRQLIGVADEAHLCTVAGALQRLGSERAAVVHGGDGLDEVSLTTTRVVEWTGLEIVDYEIEPAAYGIASAPPSALLGGEPGENARIIVELLEGRTGPHRDVVVLNAGLALVVAGIAPDLADGVERANASIDSGTAADKLERLVAVSNA